MPALGVKRGLRQDGHDAILRRRGAEDEVLLGRLQRDGIQQQHQESPELSHG